MWVKNNSRASQERIVRDWKMPPPLAEFEQKLHKATSSDDDQSIPNVAVIAADSNGKLTTFLKCMLSVLVCANSRAPRKNPHLNFVWNLYSQGSNGRHFRIECCGRQRRAGNEKVHSRHNMLDRIMHQADDKCVCHATRRAWVVKSGRRYSANSTSGVKRHSNSHQDDRRGTNLKTSQE